jgi:hypothetical protein
MMLSLNHLELLLLSGAESTPVLTRTGGERMGVSRLGGVRFLPWNIQFGFFCAQSFVNIPARI